MGGAPADVVGAVIKWMVEHPDEVPHDGTTIEAQHVCHKLGLLPDWPGPDANEAPIRYDLSGAEALRIENEIRAMRS